MEANITLNKKPYKFIEKAKTIHGEIYDYSRVEYFNNKTPVILKCIKHDHWFNIRPDMHVNIRAQGCPLCGRTKSIKSRTKTLESFIIEAQTVHGNIYDYSRAVYINALTKIEIGDRNGLWFWQTPANHLSGHGSVKERNDAFAKNYIWNSEKFIEESKKRHGDRYDYSIVEYKGSHLPVLIRCKDHGDFNQLAYCHINGQGCPKCANTFSSDHAALCNFLDELHIEYHINDREILNEVDEECRRLELDIVIPSSKLAIEYCGLRWHSEVIGKKDHRYHLTKLILANKAGYRLITIFSDEWINKRSIVEARLKSILGITKTGIGARNLDVKRLEWSTAKTFLEQHHLQGCGNAGFVRYGAYLAGCLVAVMSFGKTRFTNASYTEMLRYSTNGKSYPGVASKLLHKFIKDFNPTGIVSYADRRWSEGTLYRVLGFQQLDIPNNPGFFYLRTYYKRENRYGFTSKGMKKKLGLEEIVLSKWETMKELGYDRIWDCGNLTFLWTNPTYETH